LRDAELGGETKHSGDDDDDGLHPRHWSHARVVRWLEKLSCGKIAAIVPRDAFYNHLDGRAMSNMDMDQIFDAFTDLNVVTAYVIALVHWRGMLRENGEYRCTVR